jgi:3-oxoadipate enol-lactonase
MPTLNVTPAAEINYVADDFTDPWTQSETVLLVHGLAESVEAWRAWVPHLARHWRVIRIDQRGFGKSMPMDEDFPWSVGTLAGDLAAVIEELAPAGVHLVAAKVAGPVALRTTSARPELVRTLTLVGTPVVGPTQPDWLALVEQEDVAAWARATMDARLEGMSRAAKDWWIDMMAATPRSTMLGFLRFVSSIDVRDDLPKIQCPTLVISSDSARRPIETVAAWQKQIRDSQLVVVSGSGYHAAATQADSCAEATVKFIAEHPG